MNFDAFNAELLKMRLLPLPRVVAILGLASIAIVALITFAVKPDDTDAYRDVPIAMAEIAVMLGAIVFGAWMMGVDFAQGTLRRTMLVEPRRDVQIGFKYAATLAGVAAGAVAFTLFAIFLGELTAMASAVDYRGARVFKSAAATVLQALLVAGFSASLTLLLRSFTGGVITSFAVIFVLDGILQLWPAIRDHTFTAAMGDVASAITGDRPHQLSLAVALLVALGWIAAVAIPAAARFMRGDFK